MEHWRVPWDLWHEVPDQEFNFMRSWMEAKEPCPMEQPYKPYQCSKLTWMSQFGLKSQMHHRAGNDWVFSPLTFWWPELWNHPWPELLNVWMFLVVTAMETQGSCILHTDSVGFICAQLFWDSWNGLLNFRKSSSLEVAWARTQKMMMWAHL